MNTNLPPNKDEGSNDKMVIKSISINQSLWKQAQDRAGLMPLSAVIRRLLELWLSGKIKLDD